MQCALKLLLGHDWISYARISRNTICLPPYVCMYVNLYLNTGNHQLSLS